MQLRNLITTRPKADGSAEEVIVLYGEVGWSFTSREFVSALRELERRQSSITVHLNSEGGDVVEGMAIANAIRGSRASITVQIDGMAASMGSFIAMAPPRTTMAKYGLLMIHDCSVYMRGNTEEMQKAIEVMEEINTQLAQAYATRTGKPEKEIRALMKAETWYSPESALQEKFIHGITDPVVKEAAETQGRSVRSVAAHYNYEIERLHLAGDTTPNSNLSMKTLIALLAIPLALSADASEAEVAARVSALVKERDDLKVEADRLKAQMKERLVAELKGILDKAQSDGKFLATQRNIWETLAAESPERCKELLASTQPVTPVTERITQVDLNNAGAAVAADRKDWTYWDWAKNDEKGLEALKASNPSAFEALSKNRPTLAAWKASQKEGKKQ